MGSARSFQLAVVFAWVIGTQPVAAQTLTPGVWADYTSRGLIYDQKVDPKTKEPKTDNGLLYTAEACVIMQLSGVNYDALKGGIADALKASQIEPGLFSPSPDPEKRHQQEGPDDYWGLGALAAICGFQNIARDILSYGRGHNQPSGPTVFELSGADFGQMADRLKQCTTVPYNYNNASPGVFTRKSLSSSWMGRFPSLITHLKIAAGERPESDELAVWAAALIFSAKQEQLRIKKQDKMGSWLLSWLQVLTYQTSRYHTFAADNAVDAWWKELHSQFPEGGIKQVMKEYLAADAAGNPLGDYIDNFEWLTNSDPERVDGISNPENAIKPPLTKSCGPMGLGVCVDYQNFSPVNFLDPVNQNITAAETALSETSKAVSRQEYLLQRATSDAEQSIRAVESLPKAISDFQAQQAHLQQQLTESTNRQAEMLAKGFNKIAGSGHFQSVPCPCPKCPKHIPCPPCPCPLPIWIPGAIGDNPEFQSLLNSIRGLQNRAQDVQNKLAQAQTQLATAQQVLIDKGIVALRNERDRVLAELDKARGDIDAAKGALKFREAFVNNLIPCINPPELSPGTRVPGGIPPRRD